MPDSFVHLHTHTEYSMLDGASRVDQLMARAAELEMPAMAMTDHGVMFGAIDFYKAGQAHGVKPIIGSEIYMAPGSRFDRTTRTADHDPYHHLTLLAENQTGYQNLMKLVSRAFLEGYWYKPRADKELLAEHAEGLVCLSGCLGGEVNQRLLADDPQGARAAAAEHRDIFGADSYFIELQDHGIPEQHRTNPQLMNLADELGLGLVATNDSHYTAQADADAHDVLLCLQTGARKDEPNRMRFKGDDFWIKPAEAMHGLFPDRPETWKNTLAIAERCNVELTFDAHHLPSFPCPDGMDEPAYLRQQVAEGARWRYGDPLPHEVDERLELELAIIEQMGFPAYFLIVADLCAYARSAGIRVGPGRGSAAGCAVAYCLGITDLDPLRHGLIFERFLNPERVSMPDIDIDFDERRRGEMIRYTTEKYGDDRVAQIVTFSTIKAKQAIRDSARVLGHSYGYGDRLAKMMPPPVQGKEYPLDQARELSSELANAWDNESDAKQVLDTARSLEGLLRQHSIHAAGVVIAAEPLTNHTPLLRVEADGELVTQYDGGMVEDIGLLKMDFLGLRNLTVISDALDLIEQSTGERVDIDAIDLDDPAAYALLARGDTDGVFQLDSAGMKSLCRQLAPDCFDDVIALLALYRPGPMSAGLHSEYAERKHGRSPVTVPHPDLEDILANSYGLLVYQEQVLKIAQRLAGFSLGQADMLRRAIGKKKLKEMEAQKQAFLDGCVAQGYAPDLAQQLWDLIEGFADYAFNKSHSAGYGLVSYQTAWLKAHYPGEYMAALLTSVKTNKDRLPLYLHSCRTMGLTVLPPDVNESAVDFAPVRKRADGSGWTASGTTADGEVQIRFGLSGVRNVGDQVVESIIATREQKGAFTDFSDFVEKVEPAVLNRRTIESLIKAGAFESLGHTRKGLLQIFEDVCDEAHARKRAEAEGQYSLFGEAAGAETLAEPVEVPDVEFDRKELLVAEREMLGLYVSDHPLFGLERQLEQWSTTPISGLNEQTTAGQVTLAGVLTGVQKKFTKKGEPYVVGTLEDLKGGVDCIFFPGVYQEATEVLVDDTVLCVTGRLDEGDPPKVIASQVNAPDTSDADSAPLTLALAPQQCTEEVVAQLRKVLDTHPGAVEVQLQVANGHGRATRMRVDDELRVSRDPAVFAELKHLLGADAVR